MSLHYAVFKLLGQVTLPMAVVAELSGQHLCDQSEWSRTGVSHSSFKGKSGGGDSGSDTWVDTVTGTGALTHVRAVDTDSFSPS